ncbi:MAG: preprotein translocase subunit SecE [Acidobacteria bacterium]|nr:MAG: preprotein translocase subunit SecE [Acidobacteriota bacterium]
MNKIQQWYSGALTFLTEVRAEWKKVTRPSRKDVVTTTTVVVVTSFIFALFLWGADTVIYWAYNGVFTVLDKVSNVF